MGGGGGPGFSWLVFYFCSPLWTSLAEQPLSLVCVKSVYVRCLSVCLNAVCLFVCLRMWFMCCSLLISMLVCVFVAYERACACLLLAGHTAAHWWWRSLGISCSWGGGSVFFGDGGGEVRVKESVSGWGWEYVCKCASISWTVFVWLTCVCMELQHKVQRCLGRLLLVICVQACWHQ